MKIEICPPLPDEILYSTLARARHRLGWSTTRFSQRLFAGRTIIVRPHLCGQLDLVASVTAATAAWPFSTAQLRNNHTLFPIIAPVLEPESHDKCVAALNGDRTSRHHVGVVRRMLGITPFTSLLSCPRCRREDRSRYGETFLHRIHQVPGTTTCAHHGCVLQACGTSAEPEFYTSLDEITAFRTLRVPAGDRTLHFNIATDLWMLLQNPAAASSLAASFPHLLSLASRLSETGLSPLMGLVTIAAEAGVPLSLQLQHQHAGLQPQLKLSRTLGTDSRWLRRVCRLLPHRVEELKQTYRRRIAYLTLRREIEAHTRERLPARVYIPRTAAFIDAFVEEKAAAESRLVNVSVYAIHEERPAA